MIQDKGESTMQSVINPDKVLAGFQFVQAFEAENVCPECAKEHVRQLLSLNQHELRLLEDLMRVASKKVSS
jgi:hypothetical protein